jgi:hypothetical protein
MPKELLELIKAVNAYKEDCRREIEDNISVRDFMAMMDGLTADHEEPKKPTEYNQNAGSYKVRSLDGTVTAVDIYSTDLAQVRKDVIHLVWPHTHIEFTTTADGGHYRISQEEFDKLAAFVLQ